MFTFPKEATHQNRRASIILNNSTGTPKINRGHQRAPVWHKLGTRPWNPWRKASTASQNLNKVLGLSRITPSCFNTFYCRGVSQRVSLCRVRKELCLRCCSDSRDFAVCFTMWNDDPGFLVLSRQCFQRDNIQDHWNRFIPASTVDANGLLCAFPICWHLLDVLKFSAGYK